jgi:hypothetical protein
MKKSSLSPKDKQFLIKLAKSVDGIRASQKATDTRLTTVEYNVQAAHTRLNKLEAQMNQPGMTAEFTTLMPGFTKQEAQTKFFFTPS